MKGIARALLAAEVLGFGLAPECSVFVWKDDVRRQAIGSCLPVDFRRDCHHLALPSGKILCVPRTLLPTAFIECWFSFKRMAFLRPVEARILHGLVSLAAVGTQCLRFLRFGARK